MFRTKDRQIGDDFNLIRAFPALPGRLFAVKFSPDGNRILVGSSNDGKGEVRVYQSSDAKLVARLEGEQGPGPAYLIGQTLGVQVLAPMADPTASVMQILVATNLAQSGSFGLAQGPVYAVSYRPDGKEVASAGFDGMVRLNNPDDGKLVRAFVPVPITHRVAAK